MTDKIFWIVKHSQPDLEIAVYFICTWVQYPTKEYWGKLKMFLKYLKATKNNKRIMGSDDLLNL